jgi:hypothetical protein
MAITAAATETLKPFTEQKAIKDDQNQGRQTGRWRATVSLTDHGLKVVSVVLIEPRGAGD